MVTVRRYSDEDYMVWNDFVAKSKNSLFMFDRRYMDYHKDRFADHSLLFFREDELVAILPMNEKSNILFSHGGLTYGGFITGNTMKQHIMNECFDALIAYAKVNCIEKIIYKCIPHIYHSYPAEEDRFALFANGAKVITVDVSTYLNLRKPLKMSKGRKAQISRARREGVEIKELCELEDFNAFIELEEKVLTERHNAHAVHSGGEMKMLHDRLPENIHLYAAIKEDHIIAGSIIYEYENVIHTQYMAADEEAREIGALDLTIATIIEHYKNSKEWLDFGISTEHGIIYLNEGLCAQKESFGGRTGTYEIWEIPVMK